MTPEESDFSRVMGKSEFWVNEIRTTLWSLMNFITKGDLSKNFGEV